MFHVCLYCTVLSVSGNLVITCWERTNLLVLLCVMLPYLYATFPYGVSGQVWYMILLILDLCLLFFHFMSMVSYHTSVYWALMRTKHICVILHIRNEVKIATVFPVIFLLTVPGRVSFLLFMFHVCLYYTVLSIPCSLVVGVVWASITFNGNHQFHLKLTKGYSIIKYRSSSKKDVIRKCLAE